MESIEEVYDFLENGEKTYLRHLTIDCVIFGYEDKKLKVLLCKWLGGAWGLPGGFIKRTEPITIAASRLLKERTSLDNIFLKQFQLFGDSEYRVNDDKSFYFEGIPKGSWTDARTLSIGYYALIDNSKAKIKKDFFIEDYEWVNIEDVPNNLHFDANEIIDGAFKTLQNQIFIEPIGYELLPEKFTLPEIQTLYETILDKKLNRRHFPAKLLSLGIIEKLDEKRNIGQHRSPFLYKFNKDNYYNALKGKISLAYY